MQIKGAKMTLADMILWPGTKVCERLGVDPTGDAVLIRWLINTLVYLTVSLIIVWIVVV
ncbi:hypothetical protein SAMN05216227_1002144 [Pseudorhodobacter antarcticus]|jgi:ethanolamine utilization microcompartment shell protein EutS|uniref:Uncharacterized protein n=2 Tax=Pseudorhodobacter antarcticus TaxID=1077947 RepID=A0A1H8B6G6_9RHOB|nr:hypothetical protein SAMN05216227_1002144 [Pseudorhodobacter antarcticus]